MSTAPGPVDLALEERGDDLMERDGALSALEGLNEIDSCLLMLLLLGDKMGLTGRSALSIAAQFSPLTIENRRSMLLFKSWQTLGTRLNGRNSEKLLKTYKIL